MFLPAFIIPILVGVSAQFLKRFFTPARQSSVAIQNVLLPRYGGMPSAHAAFAFSLLTLVILLDGLYSATTAITVVFTIFIIDDALRLRIFLEQHGQALKKLIDSLPTEQQTGFPYVETRLGHQPKEVLAGMVWGIFITWILFQLL